MQVSLSFFVSRKLQGCKQGRQERKQAAPKPGRTQIPVPTWAILDTTQKIKRFLSVNACQYQCATSAICISYILHTVRCLLSARRWALDYGHARMWLAAYVVHWRRVRWQAGARWFLQHLLDGDPASNNLSWQWIASTFSHKPYIFNKENLQRYTENVYCEHCPLRNSCPFDATYEQITKKLFI